MTKSTTLHVTLLLFVTINLCRAQNMVPNPSFENYSSCPTTSGQISNCLDWYSTGGTVDYCHQCNLGSQGVPNNQWGFQVARTGMAYCRIICYYPSQVTNFREYIQVQFSNPLVAGNTYEVSFYVSCTHQQYAIDGMGAYISTTPITQFGTLIFTPIITPQISNTAGNVLMDTSSWVQISGSYLAVGGEEYLTIGTFQDDNTIQIQNIGPGGFVASYYIDDVSVTTCSTVSNTINLSICSGDSVYLQGAYQTTAGVYYDTLISASLCDSIVSTNLIVNPLNFATNTTSICDGDSILLEGNYQTTTGVYYDTLMAGSGCDTILITNLIAIQPDSTIIDISICAGDSLLLQGEYQANTGVFYDTLTTASLCDSIIKTTLIVSPIDSTNIDTSICEGDSLLLQGNYQTTTGTYYDTLTAVSGCDSILITNLVVDPTDTTIIDTNICEGDSILLQGDYQTSTGTYFNTLTAGSGCDSILITNLTISPLDSLQVPNDTSIMLGASLELLAVGSNNYLWSTGDTGNSITITPSQTTTYSVTGTNPQGCEITRTIMVTVIIQYNVFVPNVFSTTSSQQEHKRLYVYGSNIETYEFVIYDRWGEVVFETSDASTTIRQDGRCCRYGTGWNGTYMNNGKELNIGVFAYKLTGSFTNGEEFSEKGNITIIR